MTDPTSLPQAPADERHHRFALILFNGSSQVDAYLKAGFQCTRATAYVNSHKLRWKPEVANYIAALRRLHSERREVAERADSEARLQSFIASLSKGRR